jgi:hypothetical protein
MKQLLTPRPAGRNVGKTPWGRPRDALLCRRKFLRYFPKGFRDPQYLEWERDYKWSAHRRWDELLGKEPFQALLKARQFREIAGRAVRVESRTNLLFSFEKMAIRDAVRSEEGARAFAEGLYPFLHGPGLPASRFERWCSVVDSLPRRQTRVRTWPVVTVFGFLAQPEFHIYLKPTVTRTAALKYGFDIGYTSLPSREAYERMTNFAARILDDLQDLAPRDMIDVQSFIWILGSDEYPERE